MPEWSRGRPGVRPRVRSSGDASRPDRELLIGVHPVREALRAGRRVFHRLVLRGQERMPRPELAQLIESARAIALSVEEWEPDRFERLVPPGLPHQGVALEAGPLPDVEVAELGARAGARSWLIALDGIEDPQNLGAILRVAEAAGVAGALVPERRAAPLTPAVARASAGALEHVPVASVTNLTRALEELKRDHGYWVHAADSNAGDDLYQLPDKLLEGRLVLVLGAEGKGVRPGVRAAVDVFVHIPMAGRIGSLNVAAAAAVVLFEWGRRARLRDGERG